MDKIPYLGTMIRLHGCLMLMKGLTAGNAGSEAAALALLVKAQLLELTGELSPAIIGQVEKGMNDMDNIAEHSEKLIDMIGVIYNA